MKESHRPFKLDFFVDHSLPYMRGMGKRVAEVGMGQAGLVALENANVTIAIEGNAGALQTPNRSTLLVADHTTDIDDILLIGVMTKLGRQDITLTAKPYSYSSHIVAGFGEVEEKYIIPLIPGYMARDKERSGEQIPSTERIMRYLLRRDLLTEDGIQQLNSSSLHKAAELISAGNAVNVFPSGYPSNHPQQWRRGVGEILKLIPAEMRDQVSIVPYRFQDLKQWHVFNALILGNLGIPMKEQRVLFKIGETVSVTELFSGENSVDQLSGTQIARNLEEWYRPQFPFLAEVR